MKTINVKDKYWRTKQKIELLLQDQEWDSVYWNYLLSLKNKLETKGYLFPSEYKKIESWNLNIH